MHKLKIHYYDKNIIIFYKPVGLLSFEILKNKNFFLNNKLPNKGLLNRIDKYTSGILILARNELFYFFYKKMLINKLIKKNYKVFVEKKIKKGFINLSILKKKNVYIKKFNKNSITFYNIVKFNKKISFLNICIKTGRTHQIRLHLKHIKFKILNDFYNKKLFFCNTLHFNSIKFFYPYIKKNFYLSCKITNEMKKIFLFNFLK